MSNQSSRDSVDTTQEGNQLIALMSKYVFENQGLKLGQFDTFWVGFMEKHTEYKSLGKDFLRQTFVCNILPSPYEKNTYNLPEEEYIYLKFGDYDPDEEFDELSDSFQRISEVDLQVVIGHNLHRNEYSRESLLVSAQKLLDEMNEIFGPDESSSDSE